MDAKQFDVMKLILELAATAREGLDYVNAKSRTGEYETAVRMLTDVLASVAQIQEVYPVVGLDRDDSVQAATASLQEAFSHYVDRYEADDHVALQTMPEQSLLPRYVAWQETLQKALGPHTAH